MWWPHWQRCKSNTVCFSPLWTKPYSSTRVVSSLLFAAIELCDRPFAASLAGIRRANHETKHEPLSNSACHPSLTRSVSTFSQISSNDDFGTPWNQIPLRSPILPNLYYLPPLRFQGSQWNQTPKIPLTTLPRAFPSIITSSSFYSSSTISTSSPSRTSSRSPTRTIRTVSSPEVPSIPAKYRNEWPSSVVPPPPRPKSKPLLPPPDFWTDLAEKNSPRRRVSKSCEDQLITSSTLPVRNVEPPIINCPLLPYPDDALMIEKPKGDPQVRIRPSDKEEWGSSYESLRKGLYDDEMAEMGLPWNCQKDGADANANEQTVEVDRRRKGRGRGVKRKKSRTLIKLRHPGDCKPREF